MDYLWDSWKYIILSSRASSNSPIKFRLLRTLQSKIILKLKLLVGQNICRNPRLMNVRRLKSTMCQIDIRLFLLHRVPSNTPFRYAKYTQLFTSPRFQSNEFPYLHVKLSNFDILARHHSRLNSRQKLRMML